MPILPRVELLYRLIFRALPGLCLALLLAGPLAAAHATTEDTPALPPAPVYQAHVLMARDFATPWSPAEERAAWDAGLPAPAVVTTANVFALAPPRSPALAHVLSTAPPSPDGWQEVYRQSFDDGFPITRYDRACQVVTLANDLHYRWGSGAQQAYGGSRGAVSPLLALTAAAGTYPEDARLQFICVFDGLQAAHNLLVQFALRLDQGSDGDTFFAGISLDGQTFYGRRWRNTPLDAGGQPTWGVQRLFLPLATVPQTGASRVAMLWEFRSDAIRSAALGAWLDEIAVAQYIPPPAATCREADPAMQVAGAPGGQPVSKGINLPPYPVATPAGLAGHVARLRQSGVQWVRLEWQAPLTLAGRAGDLAGPVARLNYVDLRHYDELLALLCTGDQPIGVLALLDYWTLPDADWQRTGRAGDAYVAAQAAIADLLARYYADRVGYWEIWNEPDFAATYLPPGDYARLLAAVSAAIKAADGAAQVVFGGLGSADWLAASYFQQVVQALPAGPAPYDIFAIHPYPSQEFRRGGRLIRDPSYLHYTAPTVLEPFLQIMRAAGHAPRPIWITEVGWNRAADSSNPATLACQAVYETMVTGAEQAAYLPQQFDILFKEVLWAPDAAAVTKIFWYQYMDVGLELHDAACRGGRYTGGAAHVVDWWFGLYSGTDWTAGVLEPQPNLVECSFRAYPDAEALRACLPALAEAQ